MRTRVHLDVGAYLAPYGDFRAEFGLPDEPEPLSRMSYPDAAVLVRTLEYGPGVMLPNDRVKALVDAEAGVAQAGQPLPQRRYLPVANVGFAQLPSLPTGWPSPKAWHGPETYLFGADYIILSRN